MQILSHRQFQCNVSCVCVAFIVWKFIVSGAHSVNPKFAYFYAVACSGILLALDRWTFRWIQLHICSVYALHQLHFTWCVSDESLAFQHKYMTINQFRDTKFFWRHNSWAWHRNMKSYEFTSANNACIDTTTRAIQFPSRPSFFYLFTIESIFFKVVVLKKAQIVLIVFAVINDCYHNHW